MLRIGSKNKVGTGGTVFCAMLKVQRDLEKVTVTEEMRIMYSRSLERQCVTCY